MGLTAFLSIALPNFFSAAQLYEYIKKGRIKKHFFTFPTIILSLIQAAGRIIHGEVQFLLVKKPYPFTVYYVQFSAPGNGS